jgi:HlyD family secretion protein
MLQRSPLPQPPAEGVVEPEPDISEILKAGGRQRRTGRYVVVGLIVVAAVVGLWAWSALGTASSAVTYTTAPATAGDLTVTVAATGTVQPTNTVEISSELSGTVASVEADFNDSVTAGQTLATLKTDKLDANVTLARATLTARQADVRQAEVGLAESQAALDRATTLLDRGVITQEAFETAKAANDRAAAALAVANANIETANANLSIAESDLAKAAIVSPVDGVVLVRSVEVGQTVAASLSAPILFTLAEDLTRMQLEVNIDEADIARVSDGDGATFTVEAHQGRSFPARISTVRYSPETVEGVVTYKAVLSVDNADLALRPGMTATAGIVVDKVEDTLLVPNAALRYAPPAAAQSSGTRSGGLLGLLMPRPPGGQQAQQTAATEGSGRTVWVLRDGVPTAVAVEAGATDGTSTAIIGGDLQAGDEVITGSRTAS